MTAAFRDSNRSGFVTDPALTVTLHLAQLAHSCGPSAPGGTRSASADGPGFEGFIYEGRHLLYNDNGCFLLAYSASVVNSLVLYLQVKRKLPADIHAISILVLYQRKQLCCYLPPRSILCSSQSVSQSVIF